MFFDADFAQKLVICPFPPSRMHGSADDCLPMSATCFFQLFLPEYSSEEILRTRLLYAIYNCEAIDADFENNEAVAEFE